MLENRLKIFCVLLSPALLLAGAREFQEVALSPDGKQVAWVADGAIYLKEWRSDAPPARVADHARALAWSADGTRLAYLSDSEHAGQGQLYVLADGHTPARKLTGLTVTWRIPAGRRTAAGSRCCSRKMRRPEAGRSKPFPRRPA